MNIIFRFEWLNILIKSLCKYQLQLHSLNNVCLKTAAISSKKSWSKKEMKITNCTNFAQHLLNATICNHDQMSISSTTRSLSSSASSPTVPPSYNVSNLIISAVSSSLLSGNQTPTENNDNNNIFLSDEGSNSFLDTENSSSTILGTAGGGHLDPWTLVHVVVAVILWTIVITSAVGNALVIFAILKDRNLQSAQNYLICSLATADEMVSLFVMPPAAIMEVNGKWTLGYWGCYSWTSADVLSCTSSILHLVAIAFDRYWSVSDVNYSVNRSFTKIKSSILAIWMVSLIICLIPLFGWKDPDFDNRILRMECLISQDPKYQVTATITTFWVPTLVILVVYYMIFQVMIVIIFPINIMLHSFIFVASRIAFAHIYQFHTHFTTITTTVIVSGMIQFNRCTIATF